MKWWLALLLIAAPALAGEFTVPGERTALRHMRLRNGHFIIKGTTPPKLTACGTGPVALGNDTVGEIITGTSDGGSCTITYMRAYTVAPHPMLTPDSNIAVYVTAESTTGFTLNIGAPTAGSNRHINYLIVGYE